MQMLLGRFGDRRLEKGGPFFWPVWSVVAGANCAFVIWAAAAPEKFG